MAGNRMGSLKRKMGLKGPMKSGQMISRMNEMKKKNLSGYVQEGENAIKNTVKGAGDELGYLGGKVASGVKFAGRMGVAAVRNATGGDIKMILNKKTKKGIKTTGTSYGKSNKLGHGGRAAQLKHAGVPGGVIGNLARAAGAAKGQRNYHGKK